MSPSISCLHRKFRGWSSPDLCLPISPRMCPSLQWMLLSYHFWKVSELSCSGPCICLFTLRELSFALFIDIASRQVSPVPLPKGFLPEFLAFVSFLVCSIHALMLSRFSSVQLFEALWTVAHQAPLSTGFSKPKYWSGLPFPPPGDRPDPEIKPTSLMSPALTGGCFTTSATYGGFPAPPASLPVSGFSAHVTATESSFLTTLFFSISLLSFGPIRSFVVITVFRVFFFSICQ